MSSSKCKKCSKIVNSADEAVICEAGCQGWWHIRCVGITKEAYVVMKDTEQLEWKCRLCKDKEKKCNRSLMQEGGQDEELSKLGIERILEKQSMMLKEVIQVIVKEMKEMMKTIMEGKIDGLQNEMFGMGKKLDKMEKKIQELDDENYELTERCKRLEKENIEIKRKLEKKMEKEVSELEIVINGKDEINDEDRMKSILQKMELNDIKLKRVDGWKTKIGRVIKVRTKNKEDVKKIMIKRKLLFNQEEGIKVYVNEVLEEQEKKIFIKAKWCVRERLIEGVTTRNGKVGIWSGNKLLIIEDMEDLDGIIRKKCSNKDETGVTKEVKFRPPQK